MMIFIIIIYIKLTAKSYLGRSGSGTPGHFLCRLPNYSRRSVILKFIKKNLKNHSTTIKSILTLYIYIYIYI